MYKDGNSKKCRVGRGAEIFFEGRTYRSEALWPYFGKHVTVKTPDTGSGSVEAYDEDGKFIAECLPVPEFNQTARPSLDRSEEVESAAEPS